MEIPIQMPLDEGGFLRRECPHCLRQFKWHVGPANEEAEQYSDPPSYHCPFCGQPAGPGSWWTPEQLDYAQGAAMPQVAAYVEDELDAAFKGMNSKFLRFEKTGHIDTPAGPDPLVEPSDMVVVASPCHAYEPIKVPEDHTGPLHCLICGAAFAV